MKNTKLTIGQKIFFEERDHRGQLQPEFIEATIKTIGKKYFTVECKERSSYLDREKFFIETLGHEGGQYNPRYKGYLSKETVLEEREQKANTDKIRKLIGQYGNSDMTLEQTKAILAILEQSN